MTQKDLSEQKRKYNKFKHHAWGGLGLLSIVLAIRLIFLESSKFLIPVILILALYVLVALIFTYKYREGLNEPEKFSGESTSVDHEIEKERRKLEKKRAKAEMKARKKSQK
ncbi:hypothetical protein ACFLRA_01180 [Bdellovibrionota bacterium]